MEVNLHPGRYLIAVSGGVDSCVLLHVLAARPRLELIVAHFDHGMRPESAQDADFVCQLAAQYGLPFVTERAELGPAASEAAARTARYDFLRRASQQTEAQAIITAHHQDDVLETAIFNLLRGTGRRGLTSLRSTPEIIRPLLGTPKTDIYAYAIQHKLSWHEDTTNHDERYTRNYIRHRLLVRFDATARQQLLALIGRQRLVNQEIDRLLGDILAEQLGGLDRPGFNNLPHDVAREVMAGWLRAQQLAAYDKAGLERLVVHAKTKAPGKQLNVYGRRRLRITKKRLLLTR